MQFAISFDLTALFFLVIVVFKFFSQRQFPLLSNRVFGWVLIAAVLNLLCDMGGTISLTPGFPIPVAYVINTMYYMLQIGLPGMLTMYVLALQGCREKNRLLLVLYPCLVCELLLLCTVPLKLVFIIDEVNGYQYGPLYIVTYVCASVYLVTCLILSICLKKLRKAERISILVLIAISVVTMLIQFYLPSYCVTGCGIAAALVIVNFTIQDPGVMLDNTTGVFNHAALLMYLRATMDRKSHTQLLGVELHGLRQVNALYGNRDGDRLLTTLAEFLAQGKKTWVFRLSETRFVVALRDKETLETLTERLQSWEERHWPENGEAHIYVRVCCLPEIYAESDVESLISVMETALASRKQTDPLLLQLDDRELKFFQRQEAIEKALRIDLPLSRGFKLVFQPIRDLKKETFECAEVLLRYENPALGSVGPDEFVGIAERAGLAGALDEMVIRLAFTAVSTGVFRSLNFTDLHINLSSASLAGDSIAERIRQLQQETGVDPHFIVLEITETAAAMAAEEALKNMESLLDQGFRFAMDDFGTGYSSITRLLQFPFCIVKLDRSLLKSDPEVYRGLVRIFEQMGMELVAEGVENMPQAEFVRSVGVRFIQGYHFAYPQTVEELEASFGRLGGK